MYTLHPVANADTTAAHNAKYITKIEYGTLNVEDIEVAQLDKTFNPLSLAGATCSYEPTDSMIYCFGGLQVLPDVTTGFQSDYLSIYNVKTRKWVDEKRMTIPSRNNHNAVKMGNNFYVGGGIATLGTSILSDLYVIDVSAKTSSPVRVTGPAPSGRAWSCSVPVTDRFFLTFGGLFTDGTTSKVFSDIYAFDIQENKFTNLTSTSTTASRPSDRLGMACTKGPGTTMYIFGGLARGGTAGINMNDLWSFDYTTSTWTAVSNAGASAPANSPTPRFLSQMVNVDDKWLVIYGGADGLLGPNRVEGAMDTKMYFYNLAKNTWESPETVKADPAFKALASSNEGGDSGGDGGGVNVGAIAGGVVGAVVLVAAIVVGAVVYNRRRKAYAGTVPPPAGTTQQGYGGGYDPGHQQIHVGLVPPPTIQKAAETPEFHI
ncbi:Negative regulator of mitotic exit [Borealophlyctis nickersoniae]|nr:Negative regulator of mitotic exit [Borealophlyctis nickersoniae]